jgi:hypothetical protein
MGAMIKDEWVAKAATRCTNAYNYLNYPDGYSCGQCPSGFLMLTNANNSMHRGSADRGVKGGFDPPVHIFSPPSIQF